MMELPAAHIVPVLAAVGIGGLLCYFLLAWLRPSRRYTNLPPGGDESLLASVKRARDIPAWFQELREDPRPLFRQRFLGKQMAVINDESAARSLLAKDGDSNAAFWPSTTRALLGRYSLNAVHGPFHRHMRKVIAQGFSSQAIETYLPQIQITMEKRLAKWAKEDRVKMHDQARLLAFEVMAVVVAGLQLEERELLELSGHFDTFSKGCFFVSKIDLPWTAFGKAKRSRGAIIAAVEQQLARAAAAKEAGAALQQEEEEGGIGYLMHRVAASTDEKGEPLSREALQDTMVALLFAGHETTAQSMTILLMVLLDRPDVWERLREEQQQVVAALGEAITGEAVREMKYLDAVVKEVWRWHPIAPTVPRVMLRDAEVGGYTIPKGWVVAINFEPMVRADGAKRWEAGDRLGPKDFNPDRWLGPQGGGLGVLPGGNNMVFGAGGRYCIGAPLAWVEMKVMVAMLARKYQVANALDHPPSWSQSPTTFEDGLPLRITPLAA